MPPLISRSRLRSPDSFPTEGGSLLVCRIPTFQHSPLVGKGDRSRKALVDEGCFRSAYASQLCITTVTACALTRICLAGGSQTVAERSRPSGEWSGRRRTGGLRPPRKFLGVELSWLRAYRGASRPLGSKKTFFGHVGGARFARLACVLISCDT